MVLIEYANEHQDAQVYLENEWHFLANHLSAKLRYFLLFAKHLDSTHPDGCFEEWESVTHKQFWDFKYKLPCNVTHKKSRPFGTKPAKEEQIWTVQTAPELPVHGEKNASLNKEDVHLVQPNECPSPSSSDESVDRKIILDNVSTTLQTPSPIAYSPTLSVPSCLLTPQPQVVSSTTSDCQSVGRWTSTPSLHHQLA